MSCLLSGQKSVTRTSRSVDQSQCDFNGHKLMRDESANQIPFVSYTEKIEEKKQLSLI